jgi:hypothetical protein
MDALYPVLLCGVVEVELNDRDGVLALRHEIGLGQK